LLQQPIQLLTLQKKTAKILNQHQMLAAATTTPFLAVKKQLKFATTTTSSEVMIITAAIKATQKGRIPNYL